MLLSWGGLSQSNAKRDACGENKGREEHHSTMHDDDSEEIRNMDLNTVFALPTWYAHYEQVVVDCIVQEYPMRNNLLQYCCT